QSITIVGRSRGGQELARADAVIRARVSAVGPVSLERRSAATLGGERAALAALPAIRARLAGAEAERAQREAAAQADPPAPVDSDCGDTWVRRLNPFARDRACD